jgi:hypothetical protein
VEETRTATRLPALPERAPRTRRRVRARPPATKTPTPRRARQSGSPSTIRCSLLGCTTTPRRDLAAQLPLTLTFRDHNNVEKTATLPRELSLEGAPEGHDPAAGDIGYWAPGGDLVFYYDSDAPFFNGSEHVSDEEYSAVPAS